MNSLQGRKIKISVSYSQELILDTISLTTIITILQQVIRAFVITLFQQIITGIEDYFFTNCRDEIICPHCQESLWIKKGFRKDKRGVHTSLGKLEFPSLQLVGCKKCNFRYAPILVHIGLEKYSRYSQELKVKGVYACLQTTYRLASQLLVKTLGLKISAMSLWYWVQELGEKVSFEVNGQDRGIFEIDGTGLALMGTGERGGEVKVVVQHQAEAERQKGSIRIVGIFVGRYKKGWQQITGLLDQARTHFMSPFVVGDGEVFQALKGYLNTIMFQRDLWHIIHQFKYLLWQEKVPRQGALWSCLMGLMYGIVSLPGGLKREEVDRVKIEDKLDRLQQVIVQCRTGGLDKAADYLTEAQGYLFSFLDKRYPGSKIVKTSSLVERVMREINLRIDVAAQWSSQGSEHMIKLRLGVIYNQLDLETLALSSAEDRRPGLPIQAGNSHAYSERSHSRCPPE